MGTSRKRYPDARSGAWVKESAFPSFTSLFRVSGYAGSMLCESLAGITMIESDFAINAIRRAIAHSPDPTAEVVALLTDNRKLRYITGWRQHLVGAVAVVVGVSNPETIRALWEALDAGSWVSPQLAAAAFRCDPNFEAEARRRIEAGCPINIELKKKALKEWGLNTEKLDHGGRDYWHGSSKALNALLPLVRQLPETDAWLKPALESPHVQELIAPNSWEHYDEIAISWQQNMDEALKRPPISCWQFFWKRWKRDLHWRLIRHKYYK